MRLFDKLRRPKQVVVPVDFAHGDWSPLPPGAVPLAGDRWSYVAPDTSDQADSDPLRSLELDHELPALDYKALQHLLAVPEQRIDVAQFIGEQPSVELSSLLPLSRPVAAQPPLI